MKPNIRTTLYVVAGLLMSQLAHAEEPSEYTSLFAGLPPVRIFAESLAFRQKANSPDLKLSAEYWISRSLLQSGLQHIAYAGFTKIAAYEASDIETIKVQVLAIEAMNLIHARYPSFTLPRSVFLQVPRLLKSEIAGKIALWEFAFNYLEQTMDPEAVKALQGAGAFESLAQGILAEKTSKHSTAIIELNLFLKSQPLPHSLERFEDHARLLLSRSYFTVGDYANAVAELGKIKKSSNELAEVLTETAWAHLMNEKYGEAIGTSMSLRSGGLRHTFSPEGPMVMAMALNELCQFPESITAIQQFKSDYEKSFLWLASNKDISALYSEAVLFLKRKSAVPDRIGTEWVRSPTFISSQDEINLLFQENQANLKLGRSGAIELKKLGLTVRRLAAELKPEVKLERASLKPGEHLSARLVQRLHDLKDEMNHYKRLRSAASTWHRILKNHNESVPVLNGRLVKRINLDLKVRTHRMLEKIEDIAENNQLIEVEIYNGASQDIIWQNAHPEYKAVALKMNQDQKAEHADKVWDWGRASLQSEEVWEDELGSFKASLFNNCSSKERFLALRASRRKS